MCQKGTKLKLTSTKLLNTQHRYHPLLSAGFEDARGKWQTAFQLLNDHQSWTTVCASKKFQILILNFGWILELDTWLKSVEHILDSEHYYFSLHFLCTHLQFWHFINSQMCESKMELPWSPTEVILDTAGLKEGLISLYIRTFLKDTIFSQVKERANISAEWKSHSYDRWSGAFLWVTIPLYQGTTSNKPTRIHRHKITLTA